MIRPALGLALLLATACATTPSAPIAAPPDCGAPIAGADALLVPKAILFVGEMHGTRETPAAVGQLACAAARRGLAVRVGLELPHQEQARIDAYLASAGGDPARKALVAGPFWTQAYQDGRRSEAMVALIEQVRILRAAGQQVEVFTFDALEPGPTRETDMAERAHAALSRPQEGVTLLLAGNLHPRRIQAPPFAHLEPMGVKLVAKGHAITSLNAVMSGGTAWMCPNSNPDDCRVSPLGGRDLGREPKVQQLPPGGPYDALLYLGEVHASPPAAVQVAAERLVVDPDSPAALRMAGTRAYQQQDFATCADRLGRVAAKPGAAPPDLFNAACCAAKAARPDEAFALLRRALELGMPKAQLDGDEDLASLRADPRWAQLATEPAK